MQNYALEGLQQKLQKSPVLDAIRTLGTSNRAVYCNLRNTCFSLFIDLDTLIMITPKIDAPYLWIRPSGLVPLNLAYRLLQIIMDHLLIPVIILHLFIVAKTFYCNYHEITEFGITDKNSSTAYIILYEWIGTWFWTRTGGWEFDRSHGAGTSSSSHWQQVEEQAPKPVGWTMCFLLMTLVPVQKLCVNKHSLYEFCYRSYIQRECHSVLAKLHPITFYRIISVECGVRGLNATFVFSGLPIVSCSLITV